jgi:NADPH-dependent curcumin reductase
MKERTMPLNKGFLLHSRPKGDANESNFQYFEREIGDLGQGQVLIRNLWLSLDPYMRGRMDDSRSYAVPQALGEVMIGGTVGEVVESRNEKFGVGDIIVSRNGGWQLYALTDGSAIRKIDSSHAPAQAYLGPLGMPGVTAWVGLNRIIMPKQGETVVISAATGAVGTVVGQIANKMGARTVGIAGGPEKCAFALEELGFSACVDHKAANFGAQLAKATPNGVDGLFENVGGQPFALTMPRMNDFGRIAVCGLIASYEGAEPSSLSDMRIMLFRRLIMRGFIVSDFMSDWPQALSELSDMAASGQLKWRETIAEGIEQAPNAFLKMLKGKNFGKQLVKLG